MPHYEGPSNATLRSSPPPSSTPQGASRTCTSILRTHRLSAPLSCRNSSPLPSTPSRDISTTPRCGSVEKNIRTPHQNLAKVRGHTMVVTPECDHDAAAMWAGSCTTDSTYKSPFTPSSATETTEDKYEADVEYTAKACLDVLRGVIESLCASRKLKVDVETPDTLYVVVEGYRCSCNPDISFKIGADDRGERSGRYGVSHGEVPRSVSCCSNGRLTTTLSRSSGSDIK